MPSCLLNMLAAMGAISSTSVDINSIHCSNRDRIWIYCEIELVECYVSKRDRRRFLCFEKEYLRTDPHPQAVLQDAFINEEILHFLGEEFIDGEGAI